MKKLFNLIVTLVISTSAFGQKDAILGVWYNEEKDAKVKIFKKGAEYFGKIIWIEKDENADGSALKLDLKNPDPEKRKRGIVGSLILTDLEWDASDKEWDDGEIYDPKSGNTYDVYAKLESPDELYLKGYVGVSFLGRSTTWTRVEP